MLLPEAIKPAQSRESEFALTVGCRLKPDGGMADFARGEYDELTAWMKFLPENDTDYFLGGHDPNKTCDVETHPMRCETNMEKILENMVNFYFFFTLSTAQQAKTSMTKNYSSNQTLLFVSMFSNVNEKKNVFSATFEATLCLKIYCILPSICHSFY